MTSPILFTDLRKRLFEYTEEFTKRSIFHSNPIRPYKIAQTLPFEPSQHWTIYDFINGKIYKKRQDRGHMMFDVVTNIYRDPEGNAGPEHMADYVAALSEQAGVMLDCRLEHKSVLAIFDKTFTESDVDRILYCVYHTHVHGKIRIASYEEIVACEYKLIPTMNWVWFRRPGAYLSPHIPKRAQSWITQNPEFQFHLWTDLQGPEELTDFFRDIPNAAEFLSQITVHFREELWALAREFCEKHGGVSWADYEWLLNIYDDSHSIVFKTDSIRTVILSMHGGWYSDFNDTYAFVPMKYLVDNSRDEHCYIGCDDDSVTNNYLLYVPRAPYNSEWIQKTQTIMNNSIQLARTFKNPEAALKMLDIFRRANTLFCDALVADTTYPSLIEVTIPLFGPLCDDINRIMSDEYGHLKGARYNPTEFISSFLRSLKTCAPNSQIVQRMYDEGDKVVELRFGENSGVQPPMFMRNRRRRPLIRWKSQVEPWTPSAADIDVLRSVVMTPSDIVLNVIRVHIQRVMEQTNIGVLYLREQTPLKDAANYTNPIRIVPFCYLYGIYTFLTCIAHIGDGTCTGSKWEGKEESYL